MMIHCSLLLSQEPREMGDGGGEDKLLQLPQKIHPLQSFLGDGADVLLPVEVLGDNGTDRKRRYSKVSGGHRTII